MSEHKLSVYTHKHTTAQRANINGDQLERTYILWSNSLILAREKKKHNYNALTNDLLKIGYTLDLIAVLDLAKPHYGS